MNRTIVEVRRGGVGFLGLLQLLLIALKIMGYIQASWLVVLIPIFLTVSWAALIMVFAFFYMMHKK